MKKTFSLLSGLLFLLSVPSHSQEVGALLDLLVDKKVIAPTEAEQVRAELAEQQAQTSAGKLKLSNSLTELKLGGDIRERYQYDNRDFQVGPDGTTASDFGSGSQRSRWIFRLRVRADFKLGDAWFGGVELSTNQASDSGNSTYGDPRGGAGFSKYGIFLSKAYLGWNASDWATFVVGKQANPFYTTELVWDPDINPDGLSETFKLDELLSNDSARNWSLSLNFGQFLFSDNIENGGKTSEPGFNDNDVSTDAFLFGNQIQWTYKFENKSKLVFAPGVYVYNSASVFGASNTSPFTDFNSLDSSNRDRFFVGETRDLLFLTAPGEFGFKLAGIPTKFYWDFSYNPKGKSRVENVYGLVAAKNGTVSRVPLSHSSQDDFAYLLGLQLGENKKAGDLSLNANYRQIGLAAVDPNLNDSDYALSQLNIRGPKVSLTYNLTDFATIATSYAYGWNLRDDLYGGQTTTGANLANTNSVEVFQVDLSVKF